MGETRRAVISGAGGFIGSHLTLALLRAGWNVLALARHTSSGPAGFLGRLGNPRLELACGDIRHPDFLARQLRAGDTVFHLAASISVPHSYEDPRECIDTNVLGTLNLLEACRKANIRRLIHTSTSDVFGVAVFIPMDESHPIQTRSPYAASKHAADKLVQSYTCSFGVPAITIRPFNTFGPRQSSRAVIAAIILQALTTGRIRIGNSAPRRDFTFVDDTVAGFVAAAEAGDGTIGAEINLGTGRAVSIGEVAELVRAAIEPKISIEHEAVRVRAVASEVMQLVSDNTRARKLLGWSPKVPLEEGLARTIAWARRSEFGCYAR
jgi:nucleoside-diphosphate-sugar epimerase